MSDPAVETLSAREAFATLEELVADLIARLETTSRRAEDAERQSAEFGKAVGRMTGDPTSGKDLLAKLEQLEAENHDLRARLEQGRAGVDRLLARVRFLEERG